MEHFKYGFSNTRNLETNEIIIGHFHSLFFVFAADEALFDKYLWLATATGIAYSFLMHAKDDQTKDQIVKSATSTRQAS